MTDPVVPPAGLASGPQSGFRPEDAQGITSLQKRLNLREGSADAMPIEMAKWNRIKQRVNGLDTRWELNWLSAGASAFLSLAISAAIAAVAIPTGSHSGIDPVVQPALFIGAGAAAVIACALLLCFFLERSDRTRERSDIVHEMETEELAWREQRSSEVGN